MECKIVENKLVFYLDGDLPEDENQKVSQHLEGCSQCAAKLQYLKETFQWIETEKMIDVKPFLYTRIKTRMEHKNVAVRQWVLAPIAIASVLVVGLFVGTLVGKTTIRQTLASATPEYEVAFLFNDDQMENMAYKLINNQSE
jgi:anti-sigma factor RsiW